MKKYIFLNLCLSTCFFCKPTIAQIVPDTTLSNNSNVINSSSNTTVTGGTQVGGNLFHSFEKFSVPINHTIYFNNPDVQNIFSRVTGNSISNIDGRIQANGSANIFLLNPNGIIFGPSASLRIGGSFLTTTANSIIFADGTQFSAITPQHIPLLKINLPIGLQIGSNSGTITVRNFGHDLTIEDVLSLPLINSNRFSGLQVQPGKTIALVGGNVNLEGGVVISPGGKVVIAGVDRGLVRLNPSSSTWDLNYDDISAFKDINLSQRALVNTSGLNSGSVYVQGSRLILTDGSLLLNRNLGSIPLGTIDINTSDSTILKGATSDTKVPSGFFSQVVGSGTGGDIKVETGRLILQDGAQIVNLSLSNGSAGNISIDAFESVQVIGYSSSHPETISNIVTGTSSFGNAGDIKIKTANLTADKGGIIASLTNSSGAAGSLYVEVTDVLKLVGANSYSFISSGLVSTTNNTGNSGNVTVNTSKLLLQAGGTISASTTSIGKAGDVFINASDSVKVDGAFAESIKPSLIISSAQKLNPILANLLNITTEPSGSSGSVSIDTPNLHISNGGLVSVRNDGQKDAGVLRISNASNITLSNDGGITAASKSGGGGNIFLQADNIQLSQGSKITTNAANGDGNGGNIKIDTSVLSVLRNSSISADAIQGRGGNIQINTEGLLLSADSNVTAKSALGVDGTVQINTFDTQIIPTTAFAQEIVQTPKIVATCQANSNKEANTFVNTGTGGIPPNPDDILSTNSGWYDRSNVARNENKLGEKLPNEAMQIVEAQGWRQNPDGTIILTVEPTGAIGYTASNTGGCRQASATNTDTNVKSRDRQ